MNYEYLQKLKNQYDRLCMSFDSFEDAGLIPHIESSLKLSRSLYCDIITYIMYLSVADGIATEEEVQVVNAFAEQTSSSEEIMSCVKSQKLNSKKYQSTVPLSLQIAVMAEAKRTSYEDGFLKKPLPIQVYDLFSKIGKYLMRVDGDVTYMEQKQYRTYLSTLKNYMSENGYYIN